jgi:hypothetical protein
MLMLIRGGKLQKEEYELRRAARKEQYKSAPKKWNAGVPMRHKVSRVDGEPVPHNVLAEMERHPAKPWKVRD